MSAQRMGTRTVNTLIGIITLNLLLVSMTGCVINYKDVPKPSPMIITQEVNQEVRFQVEKLPILMTGGSETVKDLFEDNNLFRNATAYYERDIPEKGIFIKVSPEYQTPTLPATAFGYLSISTALIIPAWSNHDGFDIYYRVYADGELIKTFRYESRRFVALWLGLIPFSWINFMTTNEADAFTAATHQFMEDVQPILKEQLAR